VRCGFALQQYYFLSDRGHEVGVKLQPIDWFFVGAAPIEIYPAIIITEKIWIPKWERARHFFKLI